MNSSIQILLLLIFLSIVLGSWLVLRWQVYKKLRRQQENPDAWALFKQVFWNEPLVFRFAQPRLLPWFELLLIAFWALYLGLEYLDMDPGRVPIGREFGSAVVSNHLWTQIKTCGWCAVWNGSQRGGFPAFADIQGSMLHPLVIVATLAFGVVNGAKVTLIVSFWLAGVAQWWIARELNLGFLPRIWSAGIAVVGGHLSGRMELGVYGVVLSTVSVSLVFAALIRMARHNNRRNAVLLGVLTALAIVSGQGYIQIGLIGILPVFILFFWEQGRAKPARANYLTAAILALLWAAPLLVPLVHFSPNFTKAFDPAFEAAQPLSYMVLNLVIDDVRFYYNNTLDKFPYPHLYSLYIGWVPVLLFLFALNRLEGEYKKILGFLIAGAALEFFIASAIPFKLLVGFIPALAGIRHPPQIAGLAVPLILGVSAYGLERLLQINIPPSNRFIKWQAVSRLALVIALGYSLNSCMKFSLEWVGTTELTADLFETLGKLKTPGLQWVNPPFGEHAYIEPAVAAGLKLSPGILTWNWKYRFPPAPMIAAERKFPITGSSRILETTERILFRYRSQNIYAYIKTDDDTIVPCKASGSGAHIEVTCNSAAPGVLRVQENMWTGWHAWLDGAEVQLMDDARFMLPAPAGNHTFVFRYLPWDVPLGLALFLLGVAASIRLWQTPDRQGAGREE